jgi:hypothetical protein
LLSTIAAFHGFTVPSTASTQSAPSTSLVDPAATP